MLSVEVSKSKQLPIINNSFKIRHSTLGKSGFVQRNIRPQCGHYDVGVAYRYASVVISFDIVSDLQTIAVV